MTLGSEHTGRIEDTRFGVNIDGEEHGADVKGKLAFIDTTKADLLVFELMNRTRASARANLKSGTGIAEIVNFRDAGPVDIK